jgi:two-component system, LytTR family, response regulator
MISCIAIDDEPIALDVIKAHAGKIPFLNWKGGFLSPMQALKFVNEEAIDLVFLDINMPDISGTELSRHITKKAGIIFTTAHADYAIEAFELSAIDYLKPIAFERFLKACLRAQEQCRRLL